MRQNSIVMAFHVKHTQSSINRTTQKSLVAASMVTVHAAPAVKSCISILAVHLGSVFIDNPRTAVQATKVKPTITTQIVLSIATGILSPETGNTAVIVEQPNAHDTTADAPALAADHQEQSTKAEQAIPKMVIRIYYTRLASVSGLAQ